jgi:hypothetical protein
MKKLILVLMLVITASAAFSQSDSTLQQYAGKYKFPEGSLLSEITITYDKEVLLATSVMGSSELKRANADVFEVVAYSGTATFKRDATTQKIIGIKVEVGQMVLEGTLEPPVQGSN